MLTQKQYLCEMRTLEVLRNEALRLKDIYAARIVAIRAMQLNRLFWHPVLAPA